MAVHANLEAHEATIDAAVEFLGGHAWVVLVAVQAMLGDHELWRPSPAEPAAITKDKICGRCSPSRGHTTGTRRSPGGVDRLSRFP